MAMVLSEPRWGRIRQGSTPRITTWPMVKMPHDNAASFCLAGAADKLRSGSGGRVLVVSSSPHLEALAAVCFGSGLICKRRAGTYVRGKGKWIVGAAATS
jgi:hypothetical protein